MAPTKHRAVRAALQRLGTHATVPHIIEELRRYGMDASTRLVTDVKGQLQREQTKAERQRAKRPPQSKTRHRPQQRRIP